MHPISPTKMDYRQCLHDVFTRQAKISPDKIAVVSENGRRLTFRELDEQTDILAAHLHYEKGVAAESVVAMHLDRSLEMVLSSLAILKAGGTYLPLYTYYLPQTKQSIREDANVVAFITTEDLKQKLNVPDQNVILLDENWVERLMENNRKHGFDACKIPKVSPDNLAFIRYSSGTTGPPKGVTMNHSALLFGFNAIYVDYPYHEGERVAGNVFLYLEMIRPLLKGCPLYILPDSIVMEPPLVLEYFKRHSITRTLFTPSLMATILEFKHLDFAAAFKCLRYILLNGEVVTPKLMKRLATTLPWVTVINLYSTSEATDIAAINLSQLYDECDGNWPKPIYPVGKAVPGTHVLVLDDNMEVQPRGTPGEIYIGGPCVSQRGYINRPDENARLFISRPETVPEYAGDRLSRTGDRGCVHENGHIEIYGRVGYRKTIRGNTADLTVIESAIQDLPMVETCAVIYKEVEVDIDTDRYLVAYIVPSKETNQAEIRKAMNEKMAFYTIPRYIILLKSLPISPITAKLDSKALPEFVAGALNNPAEDGGKQPATHTEKTIAGFWCDLLKIEKVSVSTEFFDIGGPKAIIPR